MLLDAPVQLSASTFALGMLPAGEPAMLKVPGATLLVSPQANPAAAESALKSLRGFRGAVRRGVWWNTSELSKSTGADLRTWGRRLVEDFGAALVVVCGAGGRDVALGSRDAGLPLGRVVVCRDEATARNVLGDSVAMGDVVLALGVTPDGCQCLADRLESRFTRTALVATG
jgi:hypothetical protein